MDHLFTLFKQCIIDDAQMFKGIRQVVTEAYAAGIDWIAHKRAN